MARRASGVERRSIIAACGRTSAVPTHVFVRAVVSVRGAVARRGEAGRRSVTISRHGRDRRRHRRRPLRPEDRAVCAEDVRAGDARADARQHSLAPFPRAGPWRRRRRRRDRVGAPGGIDHGCGRPMDRSIFRRRAWRESRLRLDGGVRPRRVGAARRAGGSDGAGDVRRRRLSVLRRRPREASRRSPLLALRLEGCVRSAARQPRRCADSAERAGT